MDRAPASTLTRSTLVAYAAPALGVGMLRFVVLMYLMKFSTDVLFIAPAFIGFALGASRVWDALSDPICGYLSDRTQSRLGRRRSWLLVAAPLLPLASLALWSPPRALSGGGLDVWMAVALLLFFSISTVHAVPYDSLGAELSERHHERTRVFGHRHAALMIGMLLAIGAVGLLTESVDKRAAGLLVGAIVGVTACVTTLATVLFVRETRGRDRRPAPKPLSAIADVWKNRHARVLLVVYFMTRCGVGALASLGAYLTDYLVGDPGLLPWLIAAYALPSMLFVPLGAALTKRFGKRRVWSASMLLSAAAFAALYAVGRGDVALVVACAVVVGIGDACDSMIGRSMQADTIDADELATGERKEGVYFAVWGFAAKSAFGVSLLIAGIALQIAGYQPNVEQSEGVQTVLRIFLSVVPAGAFVAAFVLSRRYRLDAQTHAELQAQLKAKRWRNPTTSSDVSAS